MTLIKHLSREQQQKIKELIDEDINITVKQLEIVKRMEKKLKKRLRFLRDVKQSKQTLENYYNLLKMRYDSLNKKRNE
jgi:coenzyme F420-reducing hydrogenase alpha subunit